MYANESALSALNQLEALLLVVFPVQPIPSIEDIVDLPYPYDSSMETRYYDDEIEVVRQFFSGKTWPELVGKLPNCAPVADGFIYMEQEAKRYYLPAYMLTIAQYWGDPSLDIGVAAEAVMSALTNPQYKDFYAPELTSTSSDAAQFSAQIDAIKALLNDYPDALKRFQALDNPMRAPAYVVEKIQAKWEQFMCALSPLQFQAIRQFLAFTLHFYEDSFAQEVAAIVMGHSGLQHSR